jgi:hypothetical protein
MWLPRILRTQELKRGDTMRATVAFAVLSLTLFVAATTEAQSGGSIPGVVINESQSVDSIAGAVTSSQGGFLTITNGDGTVASFWVSGLTIENVRLPIVCRGSGIDVPEPSVLVLAATAGAGLLLRRRR